MLCGDSQGRIQNRDGRLEGRVHISRRCSGTKCETHDRAAREVDSAFYPCGRKLVVQCAKEAKYLVSREAG